MTLVLPDGKVCKMWHGKSAVSRGTGYTQGRVVRRGGKDSSLRMSNKAEAGMGAISMLGLVLLVALFFALIGVI
jgi:hypothetical protein